MDSIRKEFSTRALVLMALGIAINIAVGQLVLSLGLPVYLDSIGTVLVGVLVGPWAGGVTGLLASLVWTFTGLFPQAVAWAGVAFIIGALAGLFSRAGWVQVWWKAGIAGVITGFIAAFLSAPISAYVFGGVVGAGTDAIVGTFRATGLDALGANMAQGVVSDPLDKLVTFLIVWAVLLALPASIKASYGNLPEEN